MYLELWAKIMRSWYSASTKTRDLIKNKSWSIRGHHNVCFLYEWPWRRV